jgi:hypothetical protein
MKNVGNLVIASKGDGATSGSQVQMEEIAGPKAPAVLWDVRKQFEISWKRPRFLKGCRHEEKGSV